MRGVVCVFSNCRQVKVVFTPSLKNSSSHRLIPRLDVKLRDLARSLWFVGCTQRARVLSILWSPNPKFLDCRSVLLKTLLPTSTSPFLPPILAFSPPVLILAFTMSALSVNVLAPRNYNTQRPSPLVPLTAKHVPASKIDNPQRLPHSAPLTLGDVLPYSSAFDPLQSVQPYPIPRDHGAPCPFLTTFTVEEFRQFWNTERVAYQWIQSSEKNSRSIFNNKENKDQQLPAQKENEYSGNGRPRKYDWTVKHACRRNRKERTLAIDRDSVGVGCPATIRFRKLVGQERVEVVYQWRHNHDTSMESRALIPQGPNELNWAKEKVSRGLGWKAIKTILRPNEETLQSVTALVYPQAPISVNVNTN